MLFGGGGLDFRVVTGRLAPYRFYLEPKVGGIRLAPYRFWYQWKFGLNAGGGTQLVYGLGVR